MTFNSLYLENTETCGNTAEDSTHHVCVSYINPHQGCFLLRQQVCREVQHDIWDKRGEDRRLFSSCVQCALCRLRHRVGCSQLNYCWLGCQDCCFGLGFSFRCLGIQQSHEALVDAKEDSVAKWQLPHTIVVQVRQVLAVHVIPGSPGVHGVDW